MVQLLAPPEIVLGQPFNVSFSSETRVSGRLRLTRGTESLPFTLVWGEREPATGAGHRVRGKNVSLVVSDWGEHEVGTELVLRFEGVKLWLKVAAGPTTEA